MTDLHWINREDIEHVENDSMVDKEFNFEKITVEASRSLMFDGALEFRVSIITRDGNLMQSDRLVTLWTLQDTTIGLEQVLDVAYLMLRGSH